MNIKYFLNGSFKRALSLLLVFVFTAVFLFGMTQTGYAANNDTTGPTNDTTGPSRQITGPITDPSGQAQSLGFDTSRDQRTDADGNLIEPSKHPLGNDTSYINRVSQLGVISHTTYKNGNEIYNLPLSPNGINLKGVDKQVLDNELLNMDHFIRNENAKQNVVDAPKATVAADLGGIAGTEKTSRGSTQVFVTAAITQHVKDKDFVLLEISVDDYNEGKPVYYSFTAAVIKKPVGYDKYALSIRDYPIHMAAGDFNHDEKDEIAIAVGNYLCTIKINKQVDPKTGAVSYRWDKEASYFNDMLIPLVTGSKDARNEIDVAAGDADSDGYKDLLISSGDTVTKVKVNKKNVPDPNSATLYIYSGTMDLNEPTAKIPLQPQSANVKDLGKFIFTSASVDVGDAFNMGGNVIIIGGRLNDESTVITYLKYDGEGYGDMSSVNHPVYTIADNALKGMKSWLPGIKCVALDGQRGPEYVVFGNIILKYEEGTFAKQDVSHPAAKNYSNTNLAYQKSKNHYQDITDINVDGKDTTHIISTIVGNFDGNMDGREQVIMLHHNHFHDQNFVFLTWCGRETKDAAEITTHLTKIWDELKIIENMSSSNYPSIAAIDVLDTGLTVVARPEDTIFTFSDPAVIAVLAAAPFYKELGDYSDAYSSSIGNVGTTYGTGKETSSSSSNGISTSVGVSFGFTAGVNWLGGKITEFELETSITNSFTSTWSSSKSVSTSQTFTNLLADDQVVVMIVPYDIFYYDAYAKDSTEPVTIEVRVPYPPVMQNMSLTYYNKVTQDMPSAPKVTPEVLNNHVIGDPRTYALKNGQDANAFSNVFYTTNGVNSLRKKTLYSNGTFNNSLVAAGIGEGLSSQEITTTSAKEQSFDYSLDVNVTMKLTVLSKKTGVSLGVGYTHGSSTSESNSISSSGTVAGIPEEHLGYNFKWCLSVYNYNLTSDDGNTSECHVINYLTVPIGSFPPAPPQNLALKNKSLTQNSAVITWDRVEGAAEYYIYKSDSSDGKYTKVGTVSAIALGDADTSYNIAGLSSGVQAYFKVSAVSGSKEGIPSIPVPILPVDVKSISISSQPVLSYTEGDKLDLSNLSVTILYTDDLYTDVTYDKFAEKGVTTDIKNNTVMSSDNTSKKIKITYNNGKKDYTAQTGGLTVSYVQSISIARQPQLLYVEGDKLKLSDLVAELRYSNGNSVNVGFDDFPGSYLKADTPDQKVLKTNHAGDKITITYDNSYRGLEAQTRELSVLAEESGDITANMVFSYTKYDEADLSPKLVTQNGVSEMLPADIQWNKISRSTALEPEKTLYTYAIIRNNLLMSQDILVILALYDENGSMAEMTYLGGKIDAGKTRVYTLSIDTPSDINNYKAKVLVWDGTDLSTTRQIPKANIVQLP